MKYLHTMVRVTDLETSLKFYRDALGLSVTILRPPRDGRMAFVRSPDAISIELLQAGEALAPAAPWVDMPNVGSW